MELSRKLVNAVFPEFHRVASLMVYTLHTTTFYQSGVNCYNGRLNFLWNYLKIALKQLQIGTQVSLEKFCVPRLSRSVSFTRQSGAHVAVYFKLG